MAKLLNGKKQQDLTGQEEKLQNVYHDVSIFTSEDIHFFKEGTHYRLYEKFGARVMKRGDVEGVYFSVWAPNAKKVSVIGDFNWWNRDSHELGVRWDSSGIFEGFIPGLHKGNLYKFFIASNNGYCVEKKDPYSFYSEIPPKTASIVWDHDYTWQDTEWMQTRNAKNNLNAPMSIYEVHLGSWRREEGNRFLTYREHANYLVDYVKKMGFTHIQLMPIMEHPFYGSWGYQTLGYFAPTNRYGSPQDFMYFIDCCHQNGIGVLLDWVPSHFPSDEHGLAYFDGSALYEHSDPQKGFHPDWKSYIFNCGRTEVKEFLISSAMFWLDKFHIDGLRVDAVASMLYLDYSRKEGEWTPNMYGGRDNIENIIFLKQLNETVYQYYPDTQMIAEESTAWTNVSRPTYMGGLGFGMKWNMGWMHDTLEYFKKDPIYRKFHQSELTFSMLYAFTENFVLSISHDEVVHGKGSLLGKMPCDDWQKFANLRLLYGYMFAHPGKKLLFMGSEFGQWAEWNHEQSLDWHLVQYDRHNQIQKLLQDLNKLYRSEPALHHWDFDMHGYEWVDGSDWQNSILCFMRKGQSWEDSVLIACNFTPTPHANYRIGVPHGGFWKEILNSDASEYGGSGHGNFGGLWTDPIPSHGRSQSLNLAIPPLGVVYLKFSPQP
jgi:1,4-alpha-glucan branching enzyme